MLTGNSPGADRQQCTQECCRMHCVAGLNDRNFNQGLTRSYRVKPIRVSSQRSPVPKVPAIATDFRLTYRYDLPSTMDTMQTTHTQSIPTACNCRLRFSISPSCLHTSAAVLVYTLSVLPMMLQGTEGSQQAREQTAASPAATGKANPAVLSCAAKVTQEKAQPHHLCSGYC